MIVNADDLGLAEGVNRGILEAHEAGAVSSASAIVNLPAFGDAALRALAAPRLGVGLHFNIVLGRPLTRALSLTDRRTGRFLPLTALARRAFTGRIEAGDVHAECAAQLMRLRDAGIRITHVDSHRHAHALPGVWRAVCRAAHEAGVPVVRVPLEPWRVNGGDAAAAGKKLALAAAWRLASIGAPPLRRPVRFVGISLQGGHRFEVRLMRLLRALPPGTTELMVHPGHDDAELGALDPYRGAREIELAVLTSASVRDALRGLELTHFGRL